MQGKIELGQQEVDNMKVETRDQIVEDDQTLGKQKREKKRKKQYNYRGYK